MIVMVEFHPPNNSYKKQVEKYWQDVLRTPKDRNPTTATDGSRQDVSTDPVCLAHSCTGVPVTRDIGTISRGKSLFIAVNPVVVTEVEAKDDPSEPKLRKLAKEDEDSASEATLIIDNEEYKLKDLQQYRFHHGMFEVQIPPDAVAGLEPPGVCKAVADGYYVMVKPLSDGQHTIRLKAQVDTPFTEESPWIQDVTYKFEVE